MEKLNKDDGSSWGHFSSPDFSFFFLAFSCCLVRLVLGFSEVSQPSAYHSKPTRVIKELFC
jgi:hypothetical protein